MGEGTRNMDQSEWRLALDLTPTRDRDRSVQYHCSSRPAIRIMVSSRFSRVCANFQWRQRTAECTKNWEGPTIWTLSHFIILFRSLKKYMINISLLRNAVCILWILAGLVGHMHMSRFVMMITCLRDKGGMMMMGETEGRRTRRRGEDRAPEQETHQD